MLNAHCLFVCVVHRRAEVTECERAIRNGEQRVAQAQRRLEDIERRLQAAASVDNNSEIIELTEEVSNVCVQILQHVSDTCGFRSQLMTERDQKQTAVAQFQQLLATARQQLEVVQTQHTQLAAQVVADTEGLTEQSEEV